MTEKIIGYTLAEIGDGARRALIFLQDNNRWPKTVKLRETLIDMPSFQTLMARAVGAIGTATAPIPYTKVNSPPTLGENKTVGGNVGKSEYKKIARAVVEFVGNKIKNPNGNAPEWYPTSLGIMGYEHINYMLAAVLEFYVNPAKNKDGKTEAQYYPVNNRYLYIPPVSGIYASPRFRHNIKQETGYWCGPFMSAQLIYELYNLNAAQSYLASLEGTTDEGTDHDGICHGITAWVKGYGHTITCTWKNFSTTGWKAVGEMIDNPQIGLGIHGLYKNRWGHYMYPVYLNLNTGIIGIVDSLNADTDILYTDLATFEQWIANTPNNQPSLCIVTATS